MKYQREQYAMQAALSHDNWAKAIHNAKRARLARIPAFAAQYLAHAARYRNAWQQMKKYSNE